MLAEMKQAAHAALPVHCHGEIGMGFFRDGNDEVLHPDLLNLLFIAGQKKPPLGIGREPGRIRPQRLGGVVRRIAGDADELHVVQIALGLQLGESLIELVAGTRAGGEEIARHPDLPHHFVRIERLVVLIGEREAGDRLARREIHPLARPFVERGLAAGRGVVAAGIGRLLVQIVEDDPASIRCAGRQGEDHAENEQRTFHSKSPVVRRAEIFQAKANMTAQNKNVTRPHTHAEGKPAKATDRTSSAAVQYNSRRSPATPYVSGLTRTIQPSQPRIARREKMPRTTATSASETRS